MRRDEEAPHVYRYAPGYIAEPWIMWYCKDCNGWYYSEHKETKKTSTCCLGHSRLICHCRRCCDRTGRPRQGPFGFISRAEKWMVSNED